MDHRASRFLRITAATAMALASVAAAKSPNRSVDTPAGGDELELPAAEGSSGCNLAILGGTNRQVFDTFDGKLRAAAASADAHALSELVALPLRVNRKGGSQTLTTRAEVEAAAAEIFSAPVRDAILGQRAYFCTEDDGLAYGDGTVWVRLDRAAGQESYVVAVINLDAF